MAVASPPSPPSYDDIRWAGKQTPRIPVEIGGGTIYLTSLKQIDRGSGSTTATFNLVPYERDTLGAAEASMIEVDNAGSGTGATVLVLPGAFPGHIYIVYNNTGQGQTVTLKVTGQTGIAVAAGALAVLVCGVTDIQRVSPDTLSGGGTAPVYTTYVGTADAVLFPAAINVAIFTSTGPDLATLAVPGAGDVGKILYLVNTNTTQTTVTTTANKILNGTASTYDTLTAPAHAGAVAMLIATNGFWNVGVLGTGTWVLSEV